MADRLLSEWSFEIPQLPFDSWWFLGIVLVVLMFGIWLIARLTASLNDDIDPAEIDRQMLTAVRELHSQGELTPGEYRSIKGRLVERMSELDSPADSDGSVRYEQGNEQIKGQAVATTEDSKATSTHEFTPAEGSNGVAENSDTTLEDETDS